MIGHPKTRKPQTSINPFRARKLIVHKLKLQSIFMATCCIAMFFGIGLMWFSGPADESIITKASYTLPLLICVAIHFAMHRFMGKSCHARNNTRPAIDEKQIKSKEIMANSIK